MRAAMLARAGAVGAGRAVAPPAPVVAPGAPTGVGAVAGDGQATVSWNAPASTGGAAITAYRVTRSPGGVQLEFGVVFSAVVTGLANGTSYTFTVAAANSAGYGPQSAASSPVTPAAPVVPANLPGSVDGIEPEAHGYHPPMVDGNGRIYRITEAPLADNPDHNQPRMMRSLNGGASWGELDRNGRPSGNDLEGGWQLQHGTSISYCWTEGTEMHYSQFATSDASTGAETWVVSHESFATGMSAGSQQFASMARTSNGQFWFFFTDTLSGSNKQIAYARRTGTNTYTGKVKIGATSDSFCDPVCVLGAGDVTHLFFKDHANHRVYRRTLSTGGTLSASTRVDTGGTSTQPNPLSNPVYYDASGTEVVTVLFVAGSGQLRSVSVTGGVVGAEQTVTASPVLQNPGATGSDSAVVSLSVQGRTLHALWSDASTGDVYRASRVHGGAWSPRTLVWASGSNQAHWVYGRVFQRGASAVLGYTYDVGPHGDDDSNIFYNEVVLPAEAPVVEDVIVYTAGDIAEAGNNGAMLTSNIIVNANDADAVLASGDLAYDSGTLSEFNTLYTPTWGRFKSITFPAPGNHEYNTGGAAGYLSYWGAQARPDGVTYYSFDLGAYWHVVSLDSNISMTSGSAQGTWLEADLDANTKPGIIAFWHRPRFSSGTLHGSSTGPQPLWDILYAHRADIILQSHEHFYERFDRCTGSGTEVADGVRSWIVGTGGNGGTYPFGTPLAISAVRFGSTTFGVLKLTLRATDYSWEFKPAAGSSGVDTGTDTINMP